MDNHRNGPTSEQEQTFGDDPWYQALLTASRDAVMLLSMSGNLLDANHHAIDMAGWHDREWKGVALANCLFLIHQTSGDLLTPHLVKALSLGVGAVIRDGTVMDTSTKGKRFVGGTLLPVRQAAHLQGGVLVLHHGNPETELVSWDRVPHEYDLVFNSVQSPMFIMTVDADGPFRYRRVNKAEANLAQRPAEEVVGKTPREVMGDLVGSQIEARLQACVEAKQPITYIADRTYPVGRSVFQVVLTPLMVEDEVVEIIGSLHNISELKLMEESLRESETRYRAIFDHARDGIVIFPLATDGPSQPIVDVNQTIVEILGYSKDELLAMSIGDTVVPDERDRSYALRQELVANGQATYELNLQRKDGSIIPVEISSRVFDMAGQRLVAAIVRDITDRRKATEAMRYRLMVEQAVAEVSTLLVTRLDVDFDQILKILGEGVHVSRSYLFRFDHDTETMYKVHEWRDAGVPSRMEETQGVRMKEMAWFYEQLIRHEPVVIDDVNQMPDDAQDAQEFLRRLGVKSSLNVPVFSGETFYGMLGFSQTDDIHPWHSGDVDLLLASSRIIGGYMDQRASQEKIRYLSFYDKLTGLYNKTYFEEELRRLDVPRQLPISMIVGDVNGLKLVNDVFGHQVGDEMLSKVADVFRRACRQDEIIARWGGDEFMVLLPQTDLPSAYEIIGRIRRGCAEVKDAVIQMTVALGAATKEMAGVDMHSVIRAAEEDMYSRKMQESDSVRETVITSLQVKLSQEGYETVAHWQRLQALGLKFGGVLGLGALELEHLRLLAYLHDIGKLTIPAAVVHKAGPLDMDEWKMVRKHPEAGYRIALSSPQLTSVAEYILTHHERWDGRGYPRGISGRSIPYVSRIFALLDAYDMMVNEQPYRSAMSREAALQEILDNGGRQFDPDLSQRFVDMMDNTDEETDK